MFEKSDVSREATAERLASEAEELRDAGEAQERWMPLVERGLAQCAGRRDTIWARLTLLAPPSMQELFSGRIFAGRWIGADPDAVRILRSSASEDDYARTLWVYERRTIEETRALLERARGWASPDAAIRAVSVAAETLQYYHGAYREAHAALETLLEMSERSSLLEEQAKALIRLALVRIPLGELLARARDGRESSGDGGAPGHRAHALRARRHHQGWRHVSGAIHGCELRHVP